MAIIAKRYNSRVTILNVIAEDKYLDTARTYSKRLEDILEKEKVPVVVKEIRPENVVGGVVAESLDYDLLVMGASAVRRVHRSDFGLVQDRIVKSASARCWSTSGSPPSRTRKRKRRKWSTSPSDGGGDEVPLES